MDKSITQMLEEMRRLDLRLRMQLDAAETWVPQANQLVENLRSLGLLEEALLLGGIVHSSSYHPLHGPQDSGHLLQAAIGIGFGGFGIVSWDTEEHWAFYHSSTTSASLDEVRAKFCPFDRCDRSTRGLLAPQIRPLLEQVAQIAGV